MILNTSSLLPMALGNCWDYGKSICILIRYRLVLTIFSMESVNFVHDVNMMRKTFKSVYAGSEDLKALNSESGDEPGNCRVQVLPVCWRHLLEFPRRREKKNEHDVADGSGDEDECKWHFVFRL